MQNTKKSSSHVYDYAIIGSGLSGLAIAAALSKETSNIILLESRDSFSNSANIFFKVVENL
jgi:glycine/D-amino acid oxidase-like deaminating enzyme